MFDVTWLQSGDNGTNVHLDMAPLAIRPVTAGQTRDDRDQLSGIRLKVDRVFGHHGFQVKAFE